VLALSLALLALAGRAGAEERRAIEFTPIPEFEANHVKNPHDHQGKPLCQRCHFPGQPIPLAVDAISICAQCHDPARMKHPVGIPAKKKPADLPLLEDGKIVCHTCHDPHDVKRNRAGLRLPYLELCLQCHERHAGKPGADRPAAAEKPAAAPTPSVK
jgi:predicted CXXCH cytochrome family protein